MKTLLILLSLSFVIFSQPNISIHVDIGKNQKPQPAVEPPPQNFYLEPDDEDMYRPDLLMIDGNRIGFWVILPNGIRILHCRTLWYDKRNDDWYFGPWHEDRIFRFETYRRGHFYNVYFYDYMNKHYPKYYNRRLCNYHKKQKDHHENYNNQDNHHHGHKKGHGHEKH